MFFSPASNWASAVWRCRFSKSLTVSAHFFWNCWTCPAHGPDAEGNSGQKLTHFFSISCCKCTVSSVALRKLSKTLSNIVLSFLLEWRISSSFLKQMLCLIWLQILQTPLKQEETRQAYMMQAVSAPDSGRRKVC